MKAPTFTILLTPPGAGAIAVIRLVGPDAARIADQAFIPKGGKHVSQSVETPADARTAAPPPSAGGPSSAGARILSYTEEGRLRYGHISDGEEIIDDVIACRLMHAGQPAVEICAHGGIRVVERVLSLFEKLGAPFREDPQTALRVWSPRNAIQAEALAAMSAAKTERALRFSAVQQRHLSQRLQELSEQCVAAPQAALTEIHRMLSSFGPARALLSGWTIAIIGPPNSGKSTLFNQLVGRTRAVVSPRAGTTRDWVEEEIEIDGLPVRLIDTAGRHETADQLEREAMHAGSGIVRGADVIIVLLDQCAPLPPNLTILPPLLLGEAPALRATPALGSACILTANKSDLPPAWQLPDVPLQTAHRIRISATSGTGVTELARLAASLSGVDKLRDDGLALFTERQRQLMEDARWALQGGDVIKSRQIIQHKLIAGEM